MFLPPYFLILRLGRYQYWRPIRFIKRFSFDAYILIGRFFNNPFCSSCPVMLQALRGGLCSVRMAKYVISTVHYARSVSIRVFGWFQWLLSLSINVIEANCIINPWFLLYIMPGQFQSLLFCCKLIYKRLAVHSCTSIFNVLNVNVSKNIIDEMQVGHW